jgi:glycosyltransferase involved in cell wall biosynthesis
MTQTNLFQIGSGWFPELKGGAENVFFNLFHGLGDEGFAVRGIVPGSADVGRATGGMLRGFAATGTSLPRRAIAIRHFARDSFSIARPDLIASHFALYSLPLLDRFSHLPLVVHFHGPWALESLVEGANRIVVRTKKFLEQIVYRRAQRVVVLSHSFGQLLQSQFGITENVIRYVPGGVDCERFSPAISRVAAREVLGWHADRPVVFAARRLVRRMGLDRLLDAMAIVRREAGHGRTDIVLCIAGSGPERAALEAQVAALGLTDSVRFTGFLSDELLPLAYRAANLTLIPTAELEGFGLVAVESLAAGTPVLVTPVGGLPEVVSGLSSAMVLDGTDARSIAAGIAVSLKDMSLLPDAEACRCYASSRFDWKIVIPQIAAVYREVL